MQMGALVVVHTQVDLFGREGLGDGGGNPAHILGKEGSFFSGQVKVFVDVVLPGQDAAAPVGLVAEEVEPGSGQVTDGDHQVLECLVFGAVHAAVVFCHGEDFLSFSKNKRRSVIRGWSSPPACRAVPGSGRRWRNAGSQKSRCGQRGDWGGRLSAPSDGWCR